MSRTDPNIPPLLGVVLVTFNASDVILDCLETLLASRGVRLAVVLVDNASTDSTAELLRGWAEGSARPPLENLPFEMTAVPKPLPLPDAPCAQDDGHTVALIETGANLGFAGGVNCGLEALARLPGCDRFWVLNPDSIVPPGTARAFATEAGPEEGFSLMGGRVAYFDDPDSIQIDGGIVDWRSGKTLNVHRLASARDTPSPDPAEFDFITGASMVASRQFYERVGPMAEDYFLYYEEVDWALRRGDLPLAYCPDGLVYHKAGTAIGSPAPGRQATPFSLYFKHRARLMFMRRFKPRNVAMAQAWSFAKAAQLVAQGYAEGARALLAGSFGKAPPDAIRKRLPPDLEL